MTTAQHREALRNALVAIVEESGDRDYSINGLTEHYAALFCVPLAELEHEVALYEVPSLAQDIRDGARTAEDQVEELRDAFLREDMDADDEPAPTWDEAVGPVEFWGAKA